jgi:hypothetical protein
VAAARNYPGRVIGYPAQPKQELAARLHAAQQSDVPRDFAEIAMSPSDVGIPEIP